MMFSCAFLYPVKDFSSIMQPLETVYHCWCCIYFLSRRAGSQSLPDASFFFGFLGVVLLFFGDEAFLLFFICLFVFFTRLIKGSSSELSSEGSAKQQQQGIKSQIILEHITCCHYPCSHYCYSTSSLSRHTDLRSSCRLCVFLHRFLLSNEVRQRHIIIT